jgi:hypothetical protein
MIRHKIKTIAVIFLIPNTMPRSSYINLPILITNLYNSLYPNYMDEETEV